MSEPRTGALAARLAAAGCVAPAEEASELLAAGDGDPARLEALVERRLRGEPLAWVTGTVRFFGQPVAVHPGVYVPRWQSELLVGRALAVLADDGVAVDLCTGSGAVAAALGRHRPGARVIGTEIDPVAARCARANGVEVVEGHLADPLRPALEGLVDLVTAVAPYVPRGQMPFLPRDVRQWEHPAALDGGPDGLEVVTELVPAAAALLRPGGTLLVELGGHQDRPVASLLGEHGFTSVDFFADEDGDLRGVQAARRGRAK